MEGEKQQSKMGRRLVLFPLPFQGHITPMLHLATLLYSKGFSITIIHTRYNSPDPTKFPNFTFHFIDDGLPQEPAHCPSDSLAILPVINTYCLQPFRDCLSKILSDDASDRELVGCLIVDPAWKFTTTVADSFNLPRITLRTGSMLAFLVYDSLPLLQERGYFPLQETKLDETVPEFPPLKIKDLPLETHHDLLTTLVKESKTSQGIICNTFEELENSALSKLRQALPIPLFSIGPLHKHSPNCASSIREQDKSSISWLNTQAPNSVLYVSFGSVATMTEPEFQEIAWGLANSMQPFLWVVRPGSVQGSRASDPFVPEGYLDAVGGRGCVVKWAPQQEVLAHPAVGGFWTHCGWNSTLEGISQGVPMICLPFFADQAMNMRSVCDTWRIGLQLEKGMKRGEIERVIKRLMVEEEGEEMRNRVTTFKEKATLCLMEGGSSYKSLERLTSFLLSF